MKSEGSLERRYRRLPKCYPASYRADHEEEMISVLIDGAASGQEHPKPAESADLVRHGLGERLARLGDQIPGPWERKHAKAMFPIRLGIALWLCVLSGLLIGYHLQWWLVLIVPAIVAHIYLAYQLRPGVWRPKA
ncbi:hypothetical protein [Flexivirga caeni]|uniref:Uncharacterized protein n=1 Tax=Flexivirga caeni TaxID=2294115 RepID=A0A3M9M839_9MICO|nr:hypothetical protein [Flexivirga caeni]RNI21682.1 hypothetical protein EFY87_11060 [Flexivirga caeni]